jgi:hypothetical protein
MAATGVYGQPDFTSNCEDQCGAATATTLDGPRGIAAIGTRLLVPDANNSRVLLFNTAP